MAMLLLGALGVPDDEIARDYELTTQYRSSKRLYVLRPQLEAGVEVDVVLPFLTAQAPVMAATIAALEARHGSIEGYLTGPAVVARENPSSKSCEHTSAASVSRSTSTGVRPTVLPIAAPSGPGRTGYPVGRVRRVALLRCRTLCCSVAVPLRVSVPELSAPASTRPNGLGFRPPRIPGSRSLVLSHTISAPVFVREPRRGSALPDLIAIQRDSFNWFLIRAWLTRSATSARSRTSPRRSSSSWSSTPTTKTCARRRSSRWRSARRRT